MTGDDEIATPDKSGLAMTLPTTPGLAGFWHFEFISHWSFGIWVLTHEIAVLPPGLGGQVARNDVNERVSP